ncbi:hypothetical protein DRO91_10530 [Candidatus Heimdallarchaeota archaeon]|nr:MAG: hypothetical protein DRO91_10530 [Candidatus Heimdallarchaeota archaeon]
MKKLNAKKCVECGLCKNDCPVYRALLRETVSPRGKAKLIKKEMAENIMFLCTLCGACTQNCPYNIDLEIEKMREKIAEEGNDPEANKRLIKRIRKNGNPYVPTEEEKIGRFGVKKL